MSKLTDKMIEEMLEAGSNPDTAGSRTWPNWKVRDALIAALSAEELKIQNEASLKVVELLAPSGSN